MGLLDKFRRKKKEETKINVEAEKSSTELEEFLGGDSETYRALSNTMFLDPRKIGESMDEAVEEAQKSEKAQDFIKAKVWYEIAGGIAIYQGDTKKVKQYFGKCKEFSPETKYPILKKPEEAVAKAKEYYKKYLQD